MLYNIKVLHEHVESQINELVWYTHISVHVWIADIEDNVFSNLNIWMQVYTETWFISVFDA